MDLENHLLLWPAKKDRSSFPVVVMSQAEKWQDGASPALLPEPINSPCGLRLVCTSPNRGIFDHIKSWSRKLRTRVWLALCPSLYLPVCLYTDWQQHTCHSEAGNKGQQRYKMPLLFVLDGLSVQVYIWLPLPSSLWVFHCIYTV